MPDKPLWCSRLEEIVSALNALPQTEVDRASLEAIIPEVGRRRAQQLLAPVVTRQVGASSLADKARLTAHLRQVARGEAAVYEKRRRMRLARQVAQWAAQPQLWVEAPTAVVRTTLEGLPPGVALSKGRIVLDFATSQGALQQLAALIHAIGNDVPGFERAVDPGVR